MYKSDHGEWVLHSEAQAEIDRLTQQNAELLAAQQWQPIESAPKDGSVIYVRTSYGSVADMACWSPESNVKYPWLVVCIYNGEVVENRMPEDIQAEWTYLPKGGQSFCNRKGAG